MTPTEVAAFLRKYNVWRRGNLDGQPMPDPREIGEAIDAVVEMIDRLEAAEEAWKISDQTVYDLTEKVIPNIQEKLEAAEKENALRERVIDALGSELNAVANERDELRAKVEQMENQRPVAVVDDGHNADGLSARISEYLPAGMTLYATPGAQPAASVPSGLHPLETVRFWADAYTHPGDDNFRGHAMAAALLREYAELRAALAAAPEAKT